jgi:uncharacterized surface protein with fasciclin (FAS1) repeats
MKNVKIAMFIAAFVVIGSTTFAQAKTSKEKTVEVGGAPMYPSKDIVSNAVNSKDHTTLVAAVKAAGLVVRCKVLARLPYSLLPMQPLAYCPMVQLPIC